MQHSLDVVQLPAESFTLSDENTGERAQSPGCDHCLLPIFVDHNNWEWNDKSRAVWELEEDWCQDEWCGVLAFPHPLSRQIIRV